MFSSDKTAYANSAHPDQTAPKQSDQGLHCLAPSILSNKCISIRKQKYIVFFKILDHRT